MVVVSLFFVRKSIRGVYPPPLQIKIYSRVLRFNLPYKVLGIAAHLPYGEKSIRIYDIHEYFSLWKVIHYGGPQNESV